MSTMWTYRTLNDEFLNALKDGILCPLLNLVKSDDTLLLELRGNDDSINVYYRGGSLLKLYRQKNRYRVKFDEGYFDTLYARENELSEQPVEIVDSTEKCKELVAAVCRLKQAMDIYFTKNHGDEREYQQLVVKENNYGELGVSTDYFICDIEYSNDHISKTQSRTRLDLVGAHWPGDRTTRKSADSARLAIFEKKYGVGAYSGPSGISAHIEKMAPFLADDAFVHSLKVELAGVIEQKVELGLFERLNFMERFNFSNKPPEYILVLANHKPRSTKLLTELQAINQKLPFEVKVAVSSFAGYGLFDQGIFPLATFIERFREQIFAGA